MTIRRADLGKVLSEKTRKCRGSIQPVIKEFMDSGMDCAMIDSYTWYTTSGARSSALSAIKSMGLSSVVGVIMKNQVVYIYRLESYEKLKGVKKK